MDVFRIRSAKFSAVLTAVAAFVTVSITCARAQNPVALPVGIDENGSAGVYQQTIAPSAAFVYSGPSASTGRAGTADATSTFGFSEAFGGQSEQQLVLSGLTLNGSAYFTSPTMMTIPSARSKNGIDQTIGYAKGGFQASFEYLSIDREFSANQAGLLGQSQQAAKSLLSKVGQSGINSSLSFSKNHTNLGLQFASISNALLSQRKWNQTMSLNHEFDNSLTFGFVRTDTTTAPVTSGANSHLSTNVLHLAYSPIRSGFLLDSTSTRTFADNGSSGNDLLVKVAQHFAALNLTSQFESSQTTGTLGPNSDWQTQKYGATGTAIRGITFSGYWAKKTIANAEGGDDFDATIKAAETRYLELAAEFAKTDDTPSCDNSKQTLTARIVPGVTGPLGMLTVTLAISNQQVQLLNGLQTASAGVEGVIKPINKFDFGLSGSKFYLAYAESTSSSSSTRRTAHSARTLRLVSGPTGKNGLSWTVSQQQRLDQNGQPIRTASDFEVKDALNSHLSIGVNEVNEAAQSDGSFKDQDQRGVKVAWNFRTSRTIAAEYERSRCSADDIVSEDSYLLTYSGPLLACNKADFGLGEARKTDPLGTHAFGTTADLTYAWTAGTDNQMNVTSHLTDWQNHGFGGTNTPSVEETGQLNFQRTF